MAGNDNSDSSGSATCRLSGYEYIDDDMEVMSLLMTYEFNGKRFFVLASSTKTPPDYQFAESIEGRYLIKLSDLTWGDCSDEKDREMASLQKELTDLASNVCLPLMQELAPRPAPEPETFQDYMYPEVYVLQVLTMDDKLVAKRYDSFPVPTQHPPIPEERLQAISLDGSIPVLSSSDIALGTQLQNMVWKIRLDGEAEDTICKITLNVFPNAIGDELETYVKIGKSGLGHGLKVPKLKGIVRSHTGIVGILLSYIPHQHHSLRTLLQTAGSEATPAMKHKWAGQIKETLDKLHRLDRQFLIDDNNDAYIIDFGGGNTFGWVDPDKYGTMEGEMQGLKKLMQALGDE